MRSYPCFLLLVLVSCAAASTDVDAADDAEEEDSTDFDLFVFAQQWPVMDCVEWKHRSDKNTCRMRRDRNEYVKVILIQCSSS